MLFCDVVGSTALGESVDPEALQGLLARYFERMKAIVESHGGSVEKFIGDAVMAVFGVPAVHEDDALRACRAAVEMRDALPELGVAGRGSASTPARSSPAPRSGSRPATRSTSRRGCSRRPQPGEVLIGEATLALVRGAVEVEPVEPLELKGKAEPVPAYRLVAVREAPERSARDALRRPRAGARRCSRQAWSERRRERRCELVTVVGDAGVGKSRLVAEVLASDRRTDRPRPLPPLRRGDHLLAGGRGAQAARRAALRSGRGRRDPLAARRDGARRPRRRRSPGRSASCSRSRRRWSSSSTTSSGARRPSSTWSRAWRCSRPARRSCSSAWPGRSSSSAAREWPVDARLEPLPERGGRRADRRSARPSCGSGSRGGRRQPALRHRDGGDGREADGEVDVPPTPAGAARRPARPARARRAARARARRGRGRDLPPRRRPGARGRRDAGHAAAGCARPQGADPSRHGRSSPARTASASATC